jgi:transposase
MKALLTPQQINKTDRNDARGIAQMMRVGLFKPVHVKTLVAQEQRMLLTSRKLLQRKLPDLECELRGTLRNFGLKVGIVSGGRYEARIRELVTHFPRLAAMPEENRIAADLPKIRYRPLTKNTSVSPISRKSKGRALPQKRRQQRFSID